MDKVNKDIKKIFRSVTKNGKTYDIGGISGKSIDINHAEDGYVTIDGKKVSTKDNWIKALKKLGFGGLSVIMLNPLFEKVEKDAEERGYQLGLRDGIKKEHEKSESWTELNKQGVINTHKLIKDAIEKTNKRWREKIEKNKTNGKAIEGYNIWEMKAHNKALSRLLEEKE